MLMHPYLFEVLVKDRVAQRHREAALSPNRGLEGR